MKPDRTFEPLRVVRTNRYACDPAIDLVKTDLVEYRRTRDADKLVFRPGMKPAWYTVQRLSQRFVRALLGRDLAEEVRDLRAFCSAVHAIELPDGSVVRPEKLEPGLFGHDVAPEEWADDTVAVELGMGNATVEEIGRVAWELSQLAPEARGPFYYRAGG